MVLDAIMFLTVACSFFHLSIHEAHSHRLNLNLNLVFLAFVFTPFLLFQFFLTPPLGFICDLAFEFVYIVLCPVLLYIFLIVWLLILLVVFTYNFIRLLNRFYREIVVARSELWTSVPL